MSLLLLAQDIYGLRSFDTRNTVSSLDQECEYFHICKWIHATKRRYKKGFALAWDNFASQPWLIVV